MIGLLLAAWYCWPEKILVAILWACGFSSNNIIDPGRTVAEPLCNDGSAQALHLMQVQDPFNGFLV